MVLPPKRVRPEQAAPLLDAVGPAGMFVQINAPDEETAQKVLADVQQYR